MSVARRIVTALAVACGLLGCGPWGGAASAAAPAMAPATPTPPTSPTPGPCAGAGGVTIVSQSFTPPSVAPGGSASEDVVLRNCGSGPVSTQVQWYAVPAPAAGGTGIPAGCVVYDPLLTPVSIPAGGSVTVSNRYTVFASCTAASLRATVSLPQLPGAPSGTAVLTIVTRPTCTATIAQQAWPGGFTLAVSVTNQGAPLTGWTAGYTFGGDQRVTTSWSARVTQTGAAVTATGASWNRDLPTGGTVSFGSSGTWRTSSTPPSGLVLDGHACTTTVTSR